MEKVIMITTIDSLFASSMGQFIDAVQGYARIAISGLHEVDLEQYKNVFWNTYGTYTESNKGYLIVYLKDAETTYKELQNVLDF
jgi:cellobiose phosphorylase